MINKGIKAVLIMDVKYWSRIPLLSGADGGMRGVPGKERLCAVNVWRSVGILVNHRTDVPWAQPYHSLKYVMYGVDNAPDADHIMNDA